MVGTIRAEGLTVSEFRKVLTKRLSKFVIDPQIDVDVAAFRSQKIYVSGQVRNPGIVPVTDQPTTLTNVLGQAGGPTENGDLYSVILTRGKVSITLNVDRLYYDGNLAADLTLQHGDLLTVPEKAARKVFVLGEVGNQVGSNQARSYVMRRGTMTLTEVISDAGGLSPFSAAANEVYVMRLDKAGKPVVYQLDASQPQALLMAEQFQIQPRDLVFVNPTGPILLGRFIAQFLPLLQSANVANSTPF
jgi:polysaccharide export outer membrane protein